MSQHTLQSITGESSQSFVTPQLFERIVGDDKSLLAIETPRADEILAQFRQFAVRSGNSIYAWTEHDGIVSLREGEVSVPGSTRLPEALRYVHASFHFGVYLFCGLSNVLRFSPQRPQAISMLRQIARSKPGQASTRKVVLIDTAVQLAEGIDELISRYADVPMEQRRPRLRDGRWVT